VDICIQCGAWNSCGFHVSDAQIAGRLFGQCSSISSSRLAEVTPSVDFRGSCWRVKFRVPPILRVPRGIRPNQGIVLGRSIRAMTSLHPLLEARGGIVQSSASTWAVPPERACVLDALVRPGCQCWQPDCAYVWTFALSRQCGAGDLFTNGVRVHPLEECRLSAPLLYHEVVQACVGLPGRLFAPLSRCPRNTSRGMSNLSRRRSHTVGERVGWSAFDDTSDEHQRCSLPSWHLAGSVHQPVLPRRPTSNRRGARVVGTASNLSSPRCGWGALALIDLSLMSSRPAVRVLHMSRECPKLSPKRYPMVGAPPHSFSKLRSFPDGISGPLIAAAENRPASPKIDARRQRACVSSAERHLDMWRSLDAPRVRPERWLA